MADEQDRLLSVAEVAQLLSVTEPTVREWIKDGKLRAHRAGARFWRIRQSEVDRMLGEQASHQQPSPRSGLRPAAGEQARDLLSSLITNPERGANAG
ncbi:MAG: helix-turn-helix domain-containing protein [Solirubrobacteraceae bacterium]|jgi:excisionase family DNA binding protein